MRTIGLVMMIFGLTSLANADDHEPFDRYVDAFWNEIVTPHFEAYRRCGVTHFRNLGKVDSKKFDEVESSVREPCGKHMGFAREALNSIGINSKSEQIEVITSEYRIISQQFKFAYENQQHIQLTAKVAKYLQAKWTVCLIGFVKKTYKPESRKNDKLVGSAFNYCKPDEKAVYGDLKRGTTPVLGKLVDNNLFPALKQQNTQKLIRAIKELQ